MPKGAPAPVITAPQYSMLILPAHEALTQSDTPAVSKAAPASVITAPQYSGLTLPAPEALT